jgi:hypothetical protein
MHCSFCPRVAHTGRYITCWIVYKKIELVREHVNIYAGVRADTAAVN